MRMLYLDIDGSLDADQLEKRIDAVADMTQIELALRAIHPTAHGSHCILAAQPRRGTERKELSPMDVVALQLLLGSDMNREAFNFQRARILGDVPAFWHNRWNVLYTKKL